MTLLKKQFESIEMTLKHLKNGGKLLKNASKSYQDENFWKCFNNIEKTW